MVVTLAAVASVAAEGAGADGQATTSCVASVFWSSTGDARVFPLPHVAAEIVHSFITDCRRLAANKTPDFRRHASSGPATCRCVVVTIACLRLMHIPVRKELLAPRRACCVPLGRRRVRMVKRRVLASADFATQPLPTRRAIRLCVTPVDTSLWMLVQGHSPCTQPPVHDPRSTRSTTPGRRSMGRSRGTSRTATSSHPSRRSNTRPASEPTSQRIAAPRSTLPTVRKLRSRPRFLPRYRRHRCPPRPPFLPRPHSRR